MAVLSFLLAYLQSRLKTEVTEVGEDNTNSRAAAPNLPAAGVCAAEDVAAAPRIQTNLTPQSDCVAPRPT
jgi:hypothetical protein